MMRKLGYESVEDLARGYLGDPIPLLTAQRGDIVLYDGALGVCVGSRCAFAGMEGLVSQRLRDCERAWRVG